MYTVLVRTYELGNELPAAVVRAGSQHIDATTARCRPTQGRMIWSAGQASPPSLHCTCTESNPGSVAAVLPVVNPWGHIDRLRHESRRLKRAPAPVPVRTGIHQLSSGVTHSNSFFAPDDTMQWRREHTELINLFSHSLITIAGSECLRSCRPCIHGARRRHGEELSSESRGLWKMHFRVWKKTHAVSDRISSHRGFCKIF